MIILINFLSLLTPSFGQVKIIYGDNGGNSYFTNYSTEQGLALSGVASSCTDRMGNLWFGTYGGGVSKFDGKSFVTFTSASGLAGNTVLSIFEDSSGNLWFGCNREGISRYDGVKFITYTKKNGLPHNTILSMTQDNQGNLWFGTYGGGLSKFNGTTFTNYTSLCNIPIPEVRSLYVDSGGTMWIGTIGAGVFRYDGGKFSKFSFPENLNPETVFNILEDNNKNIWFGTIGLGLVKYKRGHFSAYSSKDGLPNDEIWCSYKDSRGDLWFGTKGGGFYRFKNNTFTVFSKEQGLLNNFIYSITGDKSGNIWLSSYGDGISKYRGESVTSFSSRQGLSSNLIYSILQDKKGNFWFGTYGNGLTKFSSNNSGLFLFNNSTNYSTTNGFTSADIKSLFEDQSGNIWVGTIGGGVYKIEGTTYRITNHYSKNSGLTEDRINWITQSSDKKIWICTTGGGISCLDGNNIKNYTTKDGLIDDIVLTACEDKNGYLWFGTNEGVSRFDGKNFVNFTTQNGLPHKTIFAIFQDKNGYLWFGSHGGGVSRYNGKIFSTYTFEDGLSNNTIAQILQDKKGRIYFGTNRGLTVLTGWEKNKPKFEIYNYTTGYPIRDVISGQRSMFLDNSGALWIASGDSWSAVIRFEYDKIQKHYNPVLPIIQGIKINEQKISWYNIKNPGDSVLLKQQEVQIFNKKLSASERRNLSDQFKNIKFDSISRDFPIPINLSLPYDFNDITIDFGVIDPDNLARYSYQYILDGYDEDWRPVTTKTSAVFGNLEAGIYTFKVRSQNAFGIWSNPVTYKFEVLPPWYQTTIAYIIYFISLIIFIYILVRLNTFRLKNANIQLEKIIQERTAEIEFQNEQLKEQSNQILQQKAILEELNKSKDKFFRIIAHDLRSPLNGLLNLTQTMAKEKEEFTIDEYAMLSHSIYESAKNLHRLVDNLLEWATIQQGEMKLFANKHNLFLTAQNALSSITENAVHKGIKITNDIDQNIDLIYDDKMITTVIRNLVSNAVKFTKHGGLISLISESTDNFIKIIVRDTGIGIDQETMKKLFKIDTIVTERGTENERGTGLGLLLCKEFIDQHNGKIEINSEPGKGSDFVIYLPAANI